MTRPCLDCGCRTVPAGAESCPQCGGRRIPEIEDFEETQEDRDLNEVLGDEHPY